MEKKINTSTKSTRSMQRIVFMAAYTVIVKARRLYSGINSINDYTRRDLEFLYFVSFPF